MTDDNIISDVYGDLYASCVAEAKKHFTEEQSIASSSATLYIQANKDVQIIKPIQQRFQARMKAEMPSLMSIYLWHYAPLISIFPKLGKAIRYWFHELGEIDYKALDERVRDYMERNDFDDMIDAWLEAYMNMQLRDINVEEVLSEETESEEDKEPTDDEVKAMADENPDSPERDRIDEPYMSEDDVDGDYGDRDSE